MPVFDCATGEMREHTAGEVAAIAAVPATPEQVICERERRLAAGFDHDFGDGRGVHHIGTTEADRKGWDEVSTISYAAILSGSPGQEITIKTDTGPVTVTAIEWQQVLLAAAAFRQPVWMASFALQEMAPIPANFADDGHWSAAAQGDLGADGFDLGGHA